MAAVIIAMLNGGCISLMLEFNGRLKVIAGDWPAVVFIHIAGLLTALVYLAAAGRKAPGRGTDFKDVPFKPWFLSAGAMGIGIVMSTNYGFSEGGLVFTMAGILAGQTITAAVLERISLFGDYRSSLSQQLVSLALIVPGALIVAVTSGAPISAVAAVWGGGAILMLQSLLNSRLGKRFGTPVMVTLNYSSALSVLLVIIFFMGFGPELLPAATSAPMTLLTGGGIFGVLVNVIASMLYARVPALKVMLAISLGQLFFGVLLDIAGGRTVPPEFYIGIAMVFCGLAAGRINRRRRPAV